MQPKLEADLKKAQLDRDEIKVSVLRMLLSEIHNAQISKGAELTDPEIQAVVSRELKKRREAVEAFTKGGRTEQATKEESEAAILQDYLPTQLSDEELTKLIQEAITEIESQKRLEAKLEAKGLITEIGASGVQDMGRVIGAVMSKAAGQAEGARVSELVKSILTN